MPPTLISIQVGLPQDCGRADAADPLDRPWRSGIWKLPVPGPVFVGRINLAGDAQADLKVHGGPDKAVLAYSADHYAGWQCELELTEMPYGSFGENFSLSGIAEAEVCIGDTYALGGVRVQVSQPRQPCWKLGRRWKRPDLPERVIASGRSGWYLRVIAEGHVDRGQTLELLERPFPQWSVARVAEIRYRGQHDLESTEALAACPLLSETWRAHFAARRAKAQA